MTTCAPVALFVYARLDHTRRTVESLQANLLSPQTDLIVFSDAAETSALKPAVEAVREYIRPIDGFRSVTVVERPAHLGLAASIIGGITQVLESADRVIVLEDDLVTSPNFLGFINAGLERFADDERVMHIGAYALPVADLLPPVFFFRATMCWGWGTWKRAWQRFDPSAAHLLSEIRRRNLQHAFDVDGSYSYTRLLASSAKGATDSWAIRWYASVFLAGGLVLLPGHSFVQNIGMDGTGTHKADPTLFESRSPAVIGVPSLEIPVVESISATQSIRAYYRQNRPSKLQRAVGRLTRWARSLTGAGQP